MSSDIELYTQINAERQDTFKRFINSLNFFVILLLALILQGSIYHYQRYINNFPISEETAQSLLDLIGRQILITYFGIFAVMIIVFFIIFGFVTLIKYSKLTIYINEKTRIEDFLKNNYKGELFVISFLNSIFIVVIFFIGTVVEWIHRSFINSLLAINPIIAKFLGGSIDSINYPNLLTVEFVIGAIIGIVFLGLFYGISRCVISKGKVTQNSLRGKSLTNSHN